MICSEHSESKCYARRVTHSDEPARQGGQLYDQIAGCFGGAARAMLCSHAAAGDSATKRACETDREFELPQDQNLSRAA